MSGLSGASAVGGGDGHSLALGAASQSQTTSYGYDRLYRLTTVTAPEGATSYAYDPAGNRLSRTRGGSTTSYGYDRADRITTAGGVSYTVNANGNLTARGSDTFSYDQANRLISATVGGATSTYAYDGDGKRVSSTVGGTTTRFVYDVNAGLPVLLDDGTRKYVFGLGLAYAVPSSGGVEVYHTDGLGSVRAITNAAGTVIQTYQTDEFGIPTQTSGSSEQPFGYTGEPRDGETGFVYLRARLYDPAIGRFLQRDPYPGRIGSPLSLHRYAYVGNNPVNSIDPSGHKILNKVLGDDWEEDTSPIECLDPDSDYICVGLHPQWTPGGLVLIASILKDITPPGGDDAAERVTRRQAFRSAKAKAGLGRTAQPLRVFTERRYDLPGNVRSRVYVFEREDKSIVIIKEHSAGHPRLEQGPMRPHFNTEVYGRDNGTRQPLVDGADEHTFFSP